MALLTPPDILPEAMRFLVRAVLAIPGHEVEKRELVSMVAPAGLVEAMDAMGRDVESEPDEESDLRGGGTVIVDASLTALSTLGIVAVTNDRVSLAAVPADWQRPADVDAVRFARHLLKRLVATADPHAQVGGSHPVNDLVHGLIVLHTASDPLRPFVRFEPTRSDSGRNFIDELRSRFGDDRANWPFPNREQWLPMRRWGPYLGLARPVGTNGLIPDASPALARELSHLPASEYEIGQFLSDCASAVPLLDGGSLHFGHDAEGSGEHSILSPGLSVSLLQLEADGLLAFSKLSDIGARTIRIASNGKADQVVSHAKWTPAKGSRKVGS